MNYRWIDYIPFKVIRPWLALFRLFPCSMAGLLGVVGYEVRSTPRPVFSLELCSVFAFIFLAYASANIINDIRDFYADSIQHPTRPLPSGSISRAAAWIAFICTVGTTWALASPFGWDTFYAISSVMLIGVLYSLWLKSTVLLGNATVAATAALALPIGAIAHDAVSAVVFLAYCLVALFMFSFEILKTIRDREGDLAAGYRTVTVVYGVQASVFALRVCMSSLTVVTLLLVLFQPAWPWTLLLLLGAVLPSTIMVYRLPLSPAGGHITFTLRGMTASWIPGILTIGVWLWQARGS